MKIVTIVGARPQFIKAAMVSRAIRENNKSADSPGSMIEEVLVHTGQHYDYEMSEVFFDQLDMPAPNHHLEIGSGNHGEQTGKMLAGIERVLLQEKPEVVLVYGDTNSTIAGSLAASKLHIPVGHVEGGMRSFNRRMPEEINRVVTDHIAEWHFCATKTAVDNLRSEGVDDGVYLVGDVMRDAVMHYKNVAHERSHILQRLEIQPPYALTTLHRAENTDDEGRLRNIVDAIIEVSRQMPVVLPLHPRTKKCLDEANLSKRINENALGRLLLIDPVPYIDVLKLTSDAKVILTDSGGMQKEACWLDVPCITMRDETEWLETVESGWNVLAGADKTKIVDSVSYQMSEDSAAKRFRIADIENASASIVSTLLECA
jgi:UDP-N-acetylglucosamine 2-epimerase